MSKKLLFILLGFLLLLLVGGTLWLQWGGLEGLNLGSLFGQKKIEPIAQIQPSSGPQEEVETTEWEDPAGFAFSYNKVFLMDDHPEDEVNYANLELKEPGKEGRIKILANDSPYANLEAWLENEKRVQGGSAIETNIAGLAAKKVVISEPQPRVITAFIDADQVIYLLELNPSQEERFWQRNYEVILSSFKLVPLEGEAEDSPRLLQTEINKEAGGGEVIVEEEEVVE